MDQLVETMTYTFKTGLAQHDMTANGVLIVSPRHAAVAA